MTSAHDETIRVGRGTGASMGSLTTGGGGIAIGLKLADADASAPAGAAGAPAGLAALPAAGCDGWAAACDVDNGDQGKSGENATITTSPRAIRMAPSLSPSSCARAGCGAG